MSIEDSADVGPNANPGRRSSNRARSDDIGRVLSGDVPVMDDAAIKDRFLQFQQLARELLSDFGHPIQPSFRLPGALF